MGQLSFYSAEAAPPALGDLAGLLCAPGRVTGFGRGTAARVSIELADRWRAGALATVCAELGVLTRLGWSERGLPELGSPFRADLTGLAAAWSHGGTKRVPVSFTLDGRVLRVWALAAGRWEGSAYLLGLDPTAPETRGPLLGVLTAAGLTATVIAASDGEPALRITGRRRLARLAELVGPVPSGAVPGEWPVRLGG
ncbi:hypothetical protein [Allokutzneria albata]|uniref:Uncharacterized protein n=1 Tax=Allokutzneria albata TaxID=211114 RepID=A0A1H0AKD0_ALLAB|nr:hypothetical protein [Allokutzneria albata]SDN33583.1 hypothetical protein SAMN04489726_6115 [Allokutzneria albata]